MIPTGRAAKRPVAGGAPSVVGQTASVAGMAASLAARRP